MKIYQFNVGGYGQFVDVHGPEFVNMWEKNMEAAQDFIVLAYSKEGHITKVKNMKTGEVFTALEGDFKNYFAFFLVHEIGNGKQVSVVRDIVPEEMSAYGINENEFGEFIVVSEYNQNKSILGPYNYEEALKKAKSQIMHGAIGVAVKIYKAVNEVELAVNVKSL